jgi:hypothetical protein
MRGQYLSAMAVALGVAVTGCESSSPSTGDTTAFDAAIIAADGGLEDLEMMHGPGLGLRGIVFPVLIGGRPDCPKTEDVFLCDPIQRDGIDYTRTIIYRDVSGTPQDAYDEATTASIEYTISVQGERGREGWSASIDRTRNFTVTGLQDGTGTAIWNGVSAGTMSRSRHSDDGQSRTYDVTASGSITDVVIPLPRTDDAWPLSGTITRLVSLTLTNGEDTRTREREVTIEFNGTSEVSVTVGDETFTLDLSQRMGRGRHVHRRHPR